MDELLAEDVNLADSGRIMAHTTFYCETSKEEGHGGGGYVSLLSPSAVENAETDNIRFRRVVNEITKLYSKWENYKATNANDRDGTEAKLLRDTLPWARIIKR